MTDVILIVSTAPSEEKARELGTALVNEALIACANIVPQVRSIYSWQGKLCDEHEVVMLLKTRRELFEKVRARLVELHPYECPEVLQVPIEQGHVPYLAWVRSTAKAQG
jgi:periplasmic divalent cation tolerance protein